MAGASGEFCRLTCLQGALAGDHHLLPSTLSQDQVCFRRAHTMHGQEAKAVACRTPVCADISKVLSCMGV